MSDGDTTPTAHAAGTADKSPCLENSGYVLNGKDRAISLDNISNNVGKMASILAKLYDPDTDGRSASLKRKSSSDLPDFSDSDFATQANKSVIKTVTFCLFDGGNGRAKPSTRLFLLLDIFTTK